MEFVSKNMNYIFNVEYFQHIDFGKLESEVNEKKIEDQNKGIRTFKFAKADSPLAECRQMEGYQSFALYTLYPGLIIGTGNPHEIAVAGAIKQGFTFDYVTGLPYISGSTLKGMLRSYFPGDTSSSEKNKEYQEMISGILGKEVDAEALKEDMFVNNDIFLGAFPVMDKERSIMEMEFVTPHKDKYKDPNPISMAKVKPAIAFEFSFILSDFKDQKSGNILVSAEEKKNLCKELLILMGIGAKTNVGFGKFSVNKPVGNSLVVRENRADNNHRNNASSGRNGTNGAQNSSQESMAPKCRTKGCNNTVGRKKDGSYFPVCRECNQKKWG
ncbi:MAG: type III-B CRISPR module RAMP protein Cmr6 [Lachnospiraceae bacterium]|nr:type III-B CRISPR module RAMP protein Cmr6 [Lachnospiraceae bacterium]